MTRTHNLDLPFIAAGQAQKHVTVNEGLVLIDNLLHLAVSDAPADVPPHEPELGGRWLIGPEPIGAWTGHAGELALWLDGGWRFLSPRPGWLVYDIDGEDLLVFDGTGWGLVSPSTLQQVSRLGIGAVADANNPLTARLGAVLLDALPAAEGGTDDLRLKLNRADPGGVASVLFQSTYAGCAEIGLIGDANLTAKVSEDGVDWITAVTVESGSGVVRLPANPKFRASLNHNTPVGADGWTPVPFNVADHDPRSDFDTTSHAYTAPVAGLYLFGAQVGMATDGSPPSTGYAAIWVNGAIAHEAEMRATTMVSGRGYAVLSLARPLSAGDAVDVRVYFNTNDSDLDASSCQFWGMMAP